MPTTWVIQMKGSMAMNRFDQLSRMWPWLSMDKEGAFPAIIAWTKKPVLSKGIFVTNDEDSKTTGLDFSKAIGRDLASMLEESLGVIMSRGSLYDVKRLCFVKAEGE